MRILYEEVVMKSVVVEVPDSDAEGGDELEENRELIMEHIDAHGFDSEYVTETWYNKIVEDDSE